MADNITLNSGTGGSVLAADDISSVFYQRIKINFGADGSATDVSHTNPLPIEGADAENAAISMNPVAVGGRYDSTPRTLGDGDLGAIALDADGAVHVSDGGNTLSTDWNGTAPPIGAGTEAAALRVTLATDSTGVVSIDDNSGSLTVDNAGTFAVQVDGDALTALQLIDDTVATLGTTTYTETTTKGQVVGAVRNDTLAALANTDNEIAPLQVNATGALYVQEGSALDVSAATVTVSGTVDLGATDNAVLDSIDSNTTFGAQTGGGTEASALRVTIANNSTGVISVDDNSGSLTVDNAGTFATQVDGDALTALQLIDDIVHVDDAAFTLGTSKGVMMMGFAGTQSVNANDAAALACDTDGALHVSDGGNSLTVDGTVTANLSATDNTVLDNIDTNTTGLAGCVGGSELQVDIVGSLPAGTNGIGKLTANDGVDIGDVDVTSVVAGTGATNLGKAVDSAAGGTDTGVAMLAVRDDETAAQAADGDYVQLRTDKFGSLRVTNLPEATSEIKYAVIDAASSGDNTIQAAAGAGIKIRVLSAFLVSSGTVNARFESGAGGTALTGQMNLVANSGFTLPFNPGGWFETADNTLLNLELSGAVSVDGCLTYVEI